jgi:hypothetical protein
VFLLVSLPINFKLEEIPRKLKDAIVENGVHGRIYKNGENRPLPDSGGAHYIWTGPGKRTESCVADIEEFS